MKISVCFTALVLLLLAYEVSAWWGGSSRSGSSSSRRRHKIGSNGGGTLSRTKQTSDTSSHRRDKGGWGLRKSSDRPKTSTATKKTEKKPKKGGWWGGSSRRRGSPEKSRPSVPSKTRQVPSSRAEPKKKTKGWLFSRRSSSPPKSATGGILPKEKITVNKPVEKSSTEQKTSSIKTSTNKFKNPNYIPSKPKDIKDPKDIKSVIQSFETIGGKPNLKVYNANSDPKKKDPTIGFGFSMNRANAKKTFKKVLPSVDFDKVKSGEKTITQQQAGKLFEHDLKEHVNRAKSKIGADTYNQLPANVKSAVVTSIYRGDLGPKTAGHIKKGEWDKVSTEYLNHQEYKNAKGNKMEGVVQRMNWVADQFDTMRDTSSTNDKKTEVN